ncbi:MAG: SusD/RagB family nutrient-binding outer membrane lipoprotein [Sphingobacteriales bacterium]|nr:MAG: SusD/RagB family nutrient-binding outer membrane lipoprotein [Sphingobacteriales bacterium]
MKKIIILAFGALMFTSCKKSFEKINTNPNAAESATPELLFSGASVNLGTTRTGGDLYTSMVLSAQTIASGGNFGWGAADVYDISPYSTGNVWRTYYVSTGANLKKAIMFAEQASPAKAGAIGQCKILLAETMYETTVIFGDVPFSEAWNDNIPYPKFDRQEDVLNGILQLLDEGIASLESADASATAITSYDLFYRGNINNWIALAKSLKFKVLMTMVDKVPAKAADIAALYNEGGMINGAEQNFKFPFGTSSGNRNPKYEILNQYAGGSNIFFFANKTVIDPMIADNDPRLPRYFDMGGNATDFEGVATEAEANENTSAISMNLYAPDAPEYIMTYQELLFLQAEAAVKGHIPGGVALAEQKYRQAIEASCALYGADGSAYAASKSLSGTPLRDIHLQQWIDLMDRPIEAFTTWRRSGTKGNEVPTLQIPQGAPNAGLMYRWQYPLDNELLPNINAPKEVIYYYQQQWFDL